MSKRTRLRGIGYFNWYGESKSYRSLHSRMSKRIQKPIECPMCQKPCGNLELHNINSTYLEIDSLHEWVWLCFPCHRSIHV
jgi:hypothetical protein